MSVIAEQSELSVVKYSGRCLHPLCSDADVLRQIYTSSHDFVLHGPWLKLRYFLVVFLYWFANLVRARGWMSEAGKNEKIGLCARRQPLVCTQLVCDRKSQTGKTSSEALTSHFTNKFPDIPGGFALQSCTDTLTGGNKCTRLNSTVCSLCL